MAKATGIVRRIDDLGRVVIPKELRRNLKIREGDPLEIYVDRGGQIMLKKYSPIMELGAFAQEYAESLFEALGHLSVITDKDTVVSVAGKNAKDFGTKTINQLVEEVMDKRKVQMFAENIMITTDDRLVCNSAVIAPIISGGDPIGTVIIASREGAKMGNLESKLAETAAGFLARQMEQ
ncbi:stage V sporulation protein T [Desulfocucumis palustris]|uniref:Stage V sporulation protein T n=1 Tax=Desulfocucumis palustris TaxID=1898651 RepID=A0A2L2X9Z6_9FIRM|nr:stage V sporulation protein T [Desulfocucumis palustris]GBF32872.1 stage V sporulation protein T [Desulfocucumis palustris]